MWDKYEKFNWDDDMPPKSKSKAPPPAPSLEIDVRDLYEVPSCNNSIQPNINQQSARAVVEFKSERGKKVEKFNWDSNEPITILKTELRRQYTSSTSSGNTQQGNISGKSPPPKKRPVSPAIMELTLNPRKLKEKFTLGDKSPPDDVSFAVPPVMGAALPDIVPPWKLYEKFNWNNTQKTKHELQEKPPVMGAAESLASEQSTQQKERNYYRTRTRKKALIAAMLWCVIITITFLPTNSVTKQPIINSANMIERVSVSSKVDVPPPVKLVKIELKETQVYLTDKEAYPLELAEKPEIENKEIIWQSENIDVAIVDVNGQIIPVSDGVTTVKCVDTETGDIAECSVTVELIIDAEKLELDKTKHTFKKLADTVQLKAVVLPEDATNQTFTWESSNTKIATVDENGLVTSVAKGEAVIKCKTNNGIVAACKINVSPPVMVEDLSVCYNWMRFEGYASHKIEANVYPENASNKKVTWKSTDTNVATVDEKGIVTSVGNGECEIVCISTDGSELSDSCDIKVINFEYYGTDSNTSSVNVPVNPQVANSIIDEAQRYVGIIPYVWGGTDLSSGVDCSGFICAVYQRFGYNLWALRTDLYMAGVEVPDISQAQAGDILCYPGHVALYDGNGGRVHAPDVGYMVTHDYHLGNYYTIRRIIDTY
ncbi:hypothetical protein AGMMS50284_4550 [Clostridia bacterium]|nr:hypothetical protein AGMMS50284_4550 [Clostridia bacterium]